MSEGREKPKSRRGWRGHRPTKPAAPRSAEEQSGRAAAPKEPRCMAKFAPARRRLQSPPNLQSGLARIRPHPRTRLEKARQKSSERSRHRPKSPGMRRPDILRLRRTALRRNLRRHFQAQPPAGPEQEPAPPRTQALRQRATARKVAATDCAGQELPQPPCQRDFQLQPRPRQKSPAAGRPPRDRKARREPMAAAEAEQPARQERRHGAPFHRATEASPRRNGQVQ